MQHKRGGDLIMFFKSILLLFSLVVVILIIWVVILAKFRVKKISAIIIILLLLISCVLLGSYQYLQRSSSFIFTKTTNLNENIGLLQLYENIDSKEFIKKYGTNSQRIDNALFDYYKLSNDGLVISTNKKRQIIRIAMSVMTDNGIKTSKGIGLGSSVDEVVKVYGENYYKRIDDSKGPVIGYVDRNKKITLELFYNYQNKVTQIQYDIASMN